MTEDLEKAEKKINYALKTLREISQKLTHHINWVWSEDLEQIRDLADDTYDLIKEPTKEIKND